MGLECHQFAVDDGGPGGYYLDLCLCIDPCRSTRGQGDAVAAQAASIDSKSTIIKKSSRNYDAGRFFT